LAKYNEEFRKSVVSKMMPPENRSVSELARETGVSEVTLYKWRDEIRRLGQAAPAGGKGSDRWSTEDKFLIVAETLTMSEAELSEYCRKKGLYPEQIKEWKGACISANADMASRTRDFKKEISREKKKALYVRIVVVFPEMLNLRTSRRCEEIVKVQRRVQEIGS
jgi:transposase-like protein